MTRPASKSSKARLSGERYVWIAVMILTACIVGIIAALLAYAGGSKLPIAILTGGGALSSTALLLVAIAHYVGNEN